MVLFARNGYLIELTNSKLSHGTSTDDVIKPQGLTGKYSISSLDVVDGSIDVNGVVPEQRIQPENIEETAIDDEIDFLNELVGIDDTANVSQMKESLFPEGIDMSVDNDEEEKDREIDQYKKRMNEQTGNITIAKADEHDDCKRRVNMAQEERKEEHKESLCM